MRTIKIMPHDEVDMLEGCLLLDGENVLILDFVETKAGYKVSVFIGLHEYHGGVISYAYDHALAYFGVNMGKIEHGSFKTFLYEKPEFFNLGHETFKLEFAA